MRIVIDFRAYHSENASGVENYIHQLTTQMLKLDQENQYLLFQSSSKAGPSLAAYQQANTEIVRKNFPSRLLNLLLMFFSWPKTSELIGESDIVFMPNFNFIALKATDKLALTVHDLSPVLMPEVYDFKRQVWHKLLNIPKLIKRADIIFAVSEFTRYSLVQKFGIDPKRIIVTPLGAPHYRKDELADTASLRAVRNIYNLPGKYFLFLSTIEPRKNLETILEAFENLDSDAHLVIAGKSGWKTARIFEKAARSSKAKKLHFLGYVKKEHKKHILKLAVGLLSPSLYEGFGLPLLEAFASGTPVITSNIASQPEVAGDAAILINPHDSRELLSAMHMLLADIELRQHLISRGKERVKNFTWENTAQLTLDALKSLETPNPKPQISNKFQDPKLKPDL